MESTLRIRVGSNDLKSSEGIHMKVSEIIVHERWDKEKSLNDIALYKTQNPIKFTVDGERYLVNSICLPQETDGEPPFALIIGWGQQSAEGNSVLKLQKALLPLYSKAKCKKNYETLGSVTDNQFCYGGGGDLDSCSVCFCYFIQDYSVFFQFKG